MVGLRDRFIYRVHCMVMLCPVSCLFDACRCAVVRAFGSVLARVWPALCRLVRRGRHLPVASWHFARALRADWPLGTSTGPAAHRPLSCHAMLCSGSAACLAACAMACGARLQGGEIAALEPPRRRRSLGFRFIAIGESNDHFLCIIWNQPFAGENDGPTTQGTQ
jgi:hypothetical protein